jgi:hypothetical protein
MNILKYALVIGAATVAVSANAQFGAASKSAFSDAANSQGIYINYSPFARINSGGNDANGYLLGAEKVVGEGENGPNIFGVFFSRVGGTNLYQFNYRMYQSEDVAYQIGWIDGDGTNGNITLLYMKEMAAAGDSGFSWQAFGGLNFETDNSKFNLTGGVKLSYPISNGFSIDGTWWHLRNAGTSGNFFTIGVSVVR